MRARRSRPSAHAIAQIPAALPLILVGLGQYLDERPEAATAEARGCAGTGRLGTSRVADRDESPDEDSGRDMRPAASSRP